MIFNLNKFPMKIYTIKHQEITSYIPYRAKKYAEITFKYKDVLTIAKKRFYIT